MFCICNKNCIAVCFIWVQLEFVGIPNLSFIIAKGKILHKSDLIPMFSQYQKPSRMNFLQT
jgi:hypothetical protein